MIDWPDLLMAAIIAIAVVRGYLRGFVNELSGAVALFAALATPWFYNGAADGAIGAVTHLGSGSAHVIGMFLVGVITYAIVLIAAWMLDKFARLPGLGLVNGTGGALVGLAKGVVMLWLVLYIALFFPLSPDIRADLHRSTIAQVLTQPNERLDHTAEATFPWFAQPFVKAYFKHHHV